MAIDIFNAGRNFEEQALELFHFQAIANPVYRDYLKYLGIELDSVTCLEKIPYLPISFFKTKKVVCDDLTIERVFKSSGTGKERSTHYIVDTEMYKASFVTAFEKEYGSLDEICLLGLLPNYQENPNSSLLFMMDELINLTSSNGSKYLSLQDPSLTQDLKQANQSKLKTILVGVSFALLDLIDLGPFDLNNIIVMETGGMKGRRKELTREELHVYLKNGLHVDAVHSEYGMCELMSQAYSKKDGCFTSPEWMKVSTRPIHEPFGNMEIGKTGVLKIIDLANVYSCAFIETSDIGIVHEDDSFEVLGRIDYAELRGCNLLHA